MLVGALSVATRAQAADVTNQAEFDAAIQQAITTGQPNTINVQSPTPITAGSGLVLPGLASPLALNFNLAPQFGVGYGTVGNLAIGAGTNLTFAPTTGFARFRVGVDPGGTGTVTMTGGSITSIETPGNYLVLDIGRNTGTGTFNQSGGTLNMSNGALQIGVEGGRGTYNLSGNGAVAFGTLGTIYVGDAVGGVGLLHIWDNASFTTTAQMFVGNDGGSGTITQDGAGSSVSLNSANASFGTGAGASAGTYNLIAGSLAIGGTGVIFGNTAGTTGTLNQSGGALSTAGATAPIRIGASGTGIYNLSGGTAVLRTGLSLAQAAGSIGTVNQTGGIATLSGGQIQFGAGTSTYNLNGGTLQIGGTTPIVTGAGAYQFNLGGGTLQVAGSNLVTNINFTAVGGTASIIDTNGLSATLGGVLSGAGTLVKAGNGALLLSGVNTYAGGTFLNAGIVQANADSGLGAVTGGLTFNGGTLQYLAGFGSTRAITLNAGGGIFDTNGNNATLAGGIGGAGGLTKAGAGILTLTGAGSYTGATAVNAGTLRAGIANAFAPASAYTVAGGAVLDLNSFNQTIGSLAGAGSATLGSATLTSGNDATSTTFSGALSGTGGLTKTGAGVLFLTGASSYSGPTSINAGTLDVNGTLASTVTVNAGGLLKGSGTVGGLTIANGAIVAPGNSIGTLNIAGNVTFAAGSIYQAETNAAGQSDLIAASGVATLAGGTVQALGTLSAQRTYTILTALGGVRGSFANVVATMPYAFLTPSLSYTPTSVLLNLQQSASFTSAAVTRNQISVATALGTLPASGPLFQSILTQASVASAQQAFDALSGEIHAGTKTVMLDDSYQARDAVLGRLRQASFLGASGPMSAFAFAGPVTATAVDAVTGFAGRPTSAAPPLSYADARRPGLPVKALPPFVRPSDTTWWAQGSGAWGTSNADGNAGGATRDLVGFFSGVDRRVGDTWRLGLAGGYTGANSNVTARSSSSSIDTAHLVAYAGTAYGAWNVRSGAAMGWSSVDTTRAIAFPGFADRATARYDAATAQLFGEVGYGIALGRIAAEPFAGLAWVHLHTDAFNEAGGAAALSASGSSNDIGYSTLGTRLASSHLLDNGLMLMPRVAASWQHALGDVAPSAALAFQAGGAAFAVTSVPLARDSALLEAGLDLLVLPQAKIGLAYVGRLAETTQDHSVKGNLSVRF